MKIDITLILLSIAALICYGGYDLVSTILATNYLGGFEQETSTIGRIAHDIAGIPGAAIIKIVFTLVAITGTYFIGTHLDWMHNTCIGLLVGTTIAGLFAGTSNLSILYNNTSIFILGVDAQKICILILIVFAILGAILLSENREPQYNIYI